MGETSKAGLGETGGMGRKAGKSRSRELLANQDDRRSRNREVTSALNEHDGGNFVLRQSGNRGTEGDFGGLESGLEGLNSNRSGKMFRFTGATPTRLPPFDAEGQRNGLSDWSVSSNAANQSRGYNFETTSQNDGNSLNKGERTRSARSNEEVEETCNKTPSRSKVKQIIVPEDYYSTVNKVRNPQSFDSTIHSLPIQGLQSGNISHQIGQIPQTSEYQSEYENITPGKLSGYQFGGHSAIGGQIGPDEVYHEYEDVYDIPDVVRQNRTKPMVTSGRNADHRQIQGGGEILTGENTPQRNVNKGGMSLQSRTHAEGKGSKSSNYSLSNHGLESAGAVRAAYDNRRPQKPMINDIVVKMYCDSGHESSLGSAGTGSCNYSDVASIGNVRGVENCQIGGGLNHMDVQLGASVGNVHANIGSNSYCQQDTEPRNQQVLGSRKQHVIRSGKPKLRVNDVSVDSEVVDDDDDSVFVDDSKIGENDADVQDEFSDVIKTNEDRSCPVKRDNLGEDGSEHEWKYDGTRDLHMEVGRGVSDMTEDSANQMTDEGYMKMTLPSKVISLANNNENYGIAVHLTGISTNQNAGNNLVQSSQLTNQDSLSGHVTDLSTNKEPRFMPVGEDRETYEETGV